MNRRNYVLIGYRSENKLTQFEFAEVLGISQSLLSYLENGSKDPSFNLAKTISEKINVDIGTVFPKYRI